LRAIDEAALILSVSDRLSAERSGAFLDWTGAVRP
jgi:hypothetical protein